MSARKVRLFRNEEPADLVYGEVRARLEAAGLQIGGNDLLITAQALALGYTLITDNEREFRRVRELATVNWLVDRYCSVPTATAPWKTYSGQSAGIRTPGRRGCCDTESSRRSASNRNPGPTIHGVLGGFVAIRLDRGHEQ